MGRKKGRKKSGRSSTPQTAENPNERRDPRTPPDMTVSGTSPNLVIRKEENTLYFESSDNVVINVGVNVGDVDTVVAGDVQHHYHHHASRSTLEEGARADGVLVDEYQEMEIEANLEPTAEPRTAGENEASAAEVSTRILQHVQELIASYHNVNKWEENAQLCQELHTLFKQQGNASLHKVRFDSVHFFVRVKVGPDHDAFLQACTDGTLSRGLTKLLITQELQQAAGVELTVKLDVKEISRVDDAAVEDSAGAYLGSLQETERMVEGVSPDRTFKSLQEMTPTEVKNWLVQDEDIPISIANRLEEEGINGKLLARYDSHDLREDFELSTGIMRRIIYARNDRIEAYSKQAPNTKRNIVESQGSKDKNPGTQSRNTDIYGSEVGEDSTENVGEFGKARPVEMQGITGRKDVKQDKEVQQKKGPFGVGQDPSGCHPLTREEESARVSQKVISAQDGHTETTSEYASNVKRSTGKSQSRKENDAGTAEVHEIERKADWKQGKEVQQGKSPSRIRQDISQNAPLTKEEESAEEAKLRFLLTGDENGSLDNSFHPILVVNKPMIGGSEQNDLQNLQENLDFVSLVNWNAVFDCNAKSFMNGICSMVENKREVKLLLPETFHKETSTEELEFNDVPSWIFANGREDLEDLQSPSLASDWNEKYGADVDRAVDFFATTAIPKERAVIVFLILSGDDIQIMSDIFKKFQSSLQGRGTFTFIAENQELYQMWADEVRKWLPRDQLDKRSFIGKDWKRINYYIKKQYGQVAIGPAELPFLTGKSCILPEKIRSKWLNIEVLPLNECENTAMDEGSPEFQKFVSEQELAFYQGNAVSWWNFHLSENNAKKPGFNQVLRREASRTLNKLVKEKLKSSNPSDGSNSVVTITVFHEPGSGASTSARQVLWDFHRKLRCVIVQRAIMSTVEEILEVRRYGYGQKEEIPPVLVLLDDMDDAEVIDLIAQLETATNDFGCLSCIVLHCKRTPDPGSVAENNGVNSVVIRHKLNKSEHRWFEEKFKKYGDEYSQQPERLIGFMVMKEECNPDYIRRIVSNILPEVEGNEAQLLKYIAIINRFMGDFGMPVSCCDEFMGSYKKIPSSGGKSFLKYVPWENLLSKSTCLLLIQTKVYTRNGPTKAIKLVNPVLATEVVKQLVEGNNQKIGKVIRELINDSRILDSKAYTNKYMIDKIRELLVRRREQSLFSPLVEHLLTEEEDMAFLLLKEASEKFKSGLIAQQLARLYKDKGNFVDAHRYAEMAVNFQNRPYFWDTRGRIVLDEMKKYKIMDAPLNTAETSDLLKLLNDGMNFFKRCQDLQKMESSQSSNYNAFSGELKVIFYFLQTMEQRVEPFCRSSGMQKLKNFFLTDEDIPGLDEMWTGQRQHLKSVPRRAESTLELVGDLLTYSRGETRTKQDQQAELRMRNNELLKFCEDFLRFFTVDKEQDPPKSIHENPDSVSAWRRAQVKAMKSDSFHAIFKLAQNGNKEHLKKVQDILNANQPKNAFDLRILVCISFALSSLGEDIDYDSVIRQVQKLNEIDYGLYGAFFTMMLAWPRGNLTAGSRNVGVSTEKAVAQLRGKWNDFHRLDSQKRGSQSAYDRSLPRHQTVVRKPLTHFLFAKGEGLQAFVNINMFHASQSTLEGERHRFWMRREVTERLVRLEGTIQDRERVVFRTPTKEQIYIKLSSRWHYQPSQEKVSFYLGFNFAGPVAYDVFERDRNPMPVQVKDYRETFPGYLVGQLSHLQKKEQDLVDKLEEIDYMSKKRRNRQQLTPEDKKLMQTKPRLEEELQSIRTRIQEEIEKTDDDGEHFFLVGKRGKYRVMGAVSQ